MPSRSPIPSTSGNRALLSGSSPCLPPRNSTSSAVEVDSPGEDERSDGTYQNPSGISVISQDSTDGVFIGTVGMLTMLYTKILLNDKKELS